MTAVATKGQAALSLALTGADMATVARVVGYSSEAAARTAVHRALADGVDTTTRTHHRQLASRRLDTLLAAIWDKATDPADAEQLPALRAAREIIREQIQLHGAAAPQEIIVHNPTTDQLMAWMHEKGFIKTPEVEEANPFIIEGEVVGESEVGFDA